MQETNSKIHFASEKKAAKKPT